MSSKNQKYKIYALKSPAGKLYIGKTCDLDRRLKDHARQAKNGSGYHLHRAIRKYGLQCFEINILDATTDEKEAYNLEKKYVDQLDTCNGDGYNMSPGGRGLGSGEDAPWHGKTLPRQVKAKISKSKSGEGHQLYGVTGEDNPTSRYSSSQVGSALWLLAQGWQGKEIAEVLDISKSHIFHVRSGDFRPDAEASRPDKETLKAAISLLRHKLSDHVEAFRLHSFGESVTDIASAVTLSRRSIGLLLRRETQGFRNWALILKPNTVRRLVNLEDGDMSHPHSRVYIEGINDLLPLRSS